MKRMTRTRRPSFRRGFGVGHLSRRVMLRLRSTRGGGNLNGHRRRTLRRVGLGALGVASGLAAYGIGRKMKLNRQMMQYFRTHVPA
jgi:hypothetical protein